MGYEKELDKLSNLEKLITHCRYKKLKLLLINDYVKLASFLIKLKALPDDYIETSLGCEYDSYNVKMNVSYRNYTEEITGNIDALEEITNNNLKLYEKYPFIICDNIEDDYIDFDLMNEVLKDFFGSLDNKIYRIYQLMFNNRRIMFKKNLDCAGCSYNLSFTDNPYIIINDLNSTFSMFSALAHEIGHCYEHIINKTNKPLYDYTSLIEVPGIFMHKLFEEYMLKNNLYTNKVLEEMLLWRRDIVLMNYLNSFTNLGFREDRVLEINARNSEIKIDKSLYPQDKNSIYSKSLEFFNPNLDNYIYATSDSVANYFISLYNENKKEGLREFSLFLANLYYISYRENILKYGFTSSYSEEEAKKLYNYQKRKFHL